MVTMRIPSRFGLVWLLPVACSGLCMQCQPPGSVDAAMPLNLQDGLARISDASLADAAADAEAERHLLLAKQDAVELLEEALARWEPVAAYQVTFHTQERIDGVLGGTSVIRARFLREPFGVAFRWIVNPGRIDRVVWMPSLYGGQLVVRPTGSLGRLVGTVRLDPSDEKVRRNSRRPITQFGLASVLRGVLADFRRHRDAGTLTSECLGVVAFGAEGTPAIVLERTTTDRSSESRTLLIWLEARTLRPMRVQQFGWSDELLASYTFEEYRPQAYTQKDFTLAALGME